MGIYKTTHQEKRVCIADVKMCIYNNGNKSDILIPKDTIVDSIIENTWYSYDWSSYNNYYIKVVDIFYTISEEIYYKNSISLAEWRQKQIDSVIN
jgi:hypothetical protein